MQNVWFVAYGAFMLGFGCASLLSILATRDLRRGIYGGAHVIRTSGLPDGYVPPSASLDPVDKIGGYRGGKPASEVGPPARIPSGTMRAPRAKP